MKRYARNFLGCLAALAAVQAAPLGGLPTAVHASESISEQDAYEIGKEAYVYLYPLVIMDLTRQVMTNVPAGVRPGAGPANSFANVREYPPASFRDVVRPNFDTLYSIAWLDLTREPVILSVPDTKGRYYLMPLLDMWSDVFAAPGKRTSGTGAGDFAVVPPNWRGRLPNGMHRIDAPTPYVWVIGRTQTNGPKDYEAVHEIQDGYRVTPLSHWSRPERAIALKPDPNIDMKTPPLEQVKAMSASKFFSYAAELLKKNPPHITDWSQIARLKRIGIEPGKSFDPQKVDPAVQRALDKAATDGFAHMIAKMPTLARVANGWQMNTDTMGVYGDYYLKRAIVALAGLGANQPEDAIYPLNLADAEGKPLNGANTYVLHFAKADLPPVDAFWSITLYDAQGFPVANLINRFAIGDRDPLKYNSDGSLDLYIQNANPGPEKEANWLPSPAAGEESITMRLYAPKPQALDGRWVPPAIKRLQ